MLKQIDIECTKEEWGTFFNFEKGHVLIYQVYEFVAAKCKVPPSATWRGITMVQSMNTSSTASAGTSGLTLTIDGFGTVRLTYTPDPNTAAGVSILPKKYRPSFPGSGHFQTKRTKQSRFEGRL